jgi:hypothetical protein
MSVVPAPRGLRANASRHCGRRSRRHPRCIARWRQPKWYLIALYTVLVLDRGNLSFA